MKTYKTFIKTRKTKNKPKIYNDIDRLLFDLEEETETDIDEFLTLDLQPEEFYKSNKLENQSDYITATYNEMKNWLDNHPDFLENENNYYYSFKIPKRKGGFRQIDAPIDELKEIQDTILHLFINILNILPHNAAHAYVKGRSTITMAQKHKNNNCIIKLDIKDFFNSITANILREQLLKQEIFIKINELCDKNFINLLVLIATKNGTLVQGNPLSPFLSNMIMLDFDHRLTKAISTHRIPYYTYTRYADDIYLSAPKFRYSKKVVNFIDNLLKECYNNNILLNKEKTNFLKITNKCYITGLKLNKDHNVTFGHEQKRQLKLKLYNLFVAYNLNQCPKEEIQEVLGLFSYMKAIEPNYANYLERKYLTQFESRATTLYKHFKF